MLLNYQLMQIVHVYKCFSQLSVFVGSNIFMQVGTRECEFALGYLCKLALDSCASWHCLMRVCTQIFVQIGTAQCELAQIQYLCASLHWWLPVCTGECQFALKSICLPGVTNCFNISICFYHQVFTLLVYDLYDILIVSYIVGSL